MSIVVSPEVYHMQRTLATIQMHKARARYQPQKPETVESEPVQ